MAYKLDVEVVDDEAVARPLVEGISEVPGFEAARYDMNRRRQWREFTVDHAVVDLLTQRTQLVEFDEETEQVVMVTTGTRGDPPTAVARLEDVDPQEILVLWESWVKTIPLEVASLTRPSWREQLGDLGWESVSTEVPAAAICAWPSQSAPRAVRGAVGELDTPGPITWSRRGRLSVLRLAPGAKLEGPQHRRALEQLVDRL